MVPVFWLLLNPAFAASWFCLHPSPTQQAMRLGVHWEETEPGQLSPNEQQHIPYHMTSSLAVKGKELFVLMVFVFPNNHFMCWDPAVQSWLITCLLMGSSGLISFCFASVQRFILTYLTTLSQTERLLSWFLPSSYPMGEGSELVEGLCCCMAMVSYPV